MGLLDDAIRDHLDLKRRRGADPGEVERAEREALGPVRRNSSPSDLAEEDAASPDGGLAYDQDGQDDWAHDSVQDAADEAEDVYDEPPLDAGPPPQSAEPAAPAAPAMGHAGPDTAQYDVEDALAAEDDRPDDEPEPVHREGGSDEDVLEETPEFLQDTPDHDRLWFEQRPPKDFDFDE
jgi:hypothetical protein